MAIFKATDDIRGEKTGELLRKSNLKKETEDLPMATQERARGGPKRKWRGDIEEKAGKNWTQVAQNSQTWRNLWRLPASSGVTG